MNSKQRAYLRKISAMENSLFHIGKSSVSPGLTEAVDEALSKRELVKINVLKNCADDPKFLASVLAQRTNSDVVSVVGRRFVLYRQNRDKNKRCIELPTD